MQKFLLYICLVFFSTRCAQITPLTGGKKDAVSPKVIRFSPDNASLNFRSKVIEVQFDEYITIRDIANQFIITPQTNETPDIEVSGKTMKIIFNETLLPNTTYKLAFGNAISDLNESNILQNFEYIFSTGSNIDSLKLFGRIVNATDQKPAKEILIGLYDKGSSDSVMYKEKPLYISKSDENGNFKFSYLPNSLFKIIGIKDQNKNLLYDGSEEQIAYSNEFAKPADTSSIALTLFKEQASRTFVRKAFSAEYGKAYVIFNRPQKDITEVIAKGLISYNQTKLKDTLIVYYKNTFDTLQTIIHYTSRKTDTLYIKTSNKFSFDRRLKSNDIKYILRTNLTPLLPFYEMPSIELNVPVDSGNLSEEKIILIEQTDTSSKKIPFTLVKEDKWITSFKIRAELKPETSYALTFNKAAITSDDQRTNDSITYRFKTTSIDDHAQLRLKLFFPRKENYIIRLLNDKEQILDEKIVEFALNSTSEKIIDYKNLFPGNYFIQVVEDANKNGLFDTGDYFLKKQPELIFINPVPIKLLAGWEIENEWIIK
ncbi:MAG: Ig-like domain-containing protein [Bacteroidota bacterium]